MRPKWQAEKEECIKVITENTNNTSNRNNGNKLYVLLDMYDI